MKKQAGKKVCFISGVSISGNIFLPDSVFFFVNLKVMKIHKVYILTYISCLGSQSPMTHYAIMQIKEMANLLLNHT